MSTKKYSFRKFINDIHLWFGLISGIILFVICFSGTLFTFRDEIDSWINPNKFKSESYRPGKKAIDLDYLISQLEKTEKGKVAFVNISEDPKKNYEFGLIKTNNHEKRPESLKDNKISVSGETTIKKEITIKEKEKPKRIRPVTYYIDPYSGKLMGVSTDKTSAFFLTIMKLHRWLLVDSNIGRPIVGIATLIFIIICFTGLILWLPKKLKYCKKWGHWKQGFLIKFNTNWKRINHDLHNTLGFYSIIFLLIMGLTGLCWSFDWYRSGLSSLIGTEVFGGRNEPVEKIEVKNQPILSTLNLIDLANKKLNYTGTVKVNFPKEFNSVYIISKNKTGFFALAASDKVAINPYTGEITKVNYFKDNSLNVKIASLIKPLHTGEIFGTFSKIIYFITCLIGTSLPITGTLIWINKMKKKKKGS